MDEEREIEIGCVLENNDTTGTETEHVYAGYDRRRLMIGTDVGMMAGTIHRHSNKWKQQSRQVIR